MYVVDVEVLIQKTIKEFWVDSNKYYVCFVTDTETLLFRAASESPSTDSWFEEINGIENLIDSKILSIQVKRFPQTKEGNNFIKTIGYTFTTSKGYFDIIFRNSSNGFYGGNMKKCYMSNVEMLNLNLKNYLHVMKDED